MSRAVGVVPTDGRGSLPFALLHGESLVAMSAWSVGDAEVRLLDFDTPWSAVVAAELPLLVHDPLCPGTPASFLVEAVERAVRDDVVVVGYTGPADSTDEDHDRSGPEAVASPVVLPVSVIGRLDSWPSLDDLGGWVAHLREQFEVVFVEAPAAARRVSDESDVRLLDASLKTARDTQVR